ncbi:MAG TPA: hypothetical protein QF401_01225 [Candidatus Poseidoniaceae archaeon]|jgi:surface polysaccharide O-acyltransferase-like enzyme|nr:hypothetical protein [Candidatus Poseidoniaceae archaeon]
MASRLQQRLAELDTPDDMTDEEEIWSLVRLSLVILRIILFVAIIAVSELMESYAIYGISMALWALIIGIPLFILISGGIILGDRIVKKKEAGIVEKTLLRPIRERL